MISSTKNDIINSGRKTKQSTETGDVNSMHFPVLSSSMTDHEMLTLPEHSRFVMEFTLLGLYFSVLCFVDRCLSCLF